MTRFLLLRLTVQRVSPKMSAMSSSLSSWCGESPPARPPGGSLQARSISLSSEGTAARTGTSRWRRSWSGTDATHSSFPLAAPLTPSCASSPRREGEEAGPRAGTVTRGGRPCWAADAGTRPTRAPAGSHGVSRASCIRGAPVTNGESPAANPSPC